MLVLAAGVCGGQVRQAMVEELPERLRDARWLAEIGESTAQRVRDGEWDHVVHYALQSRRFTTLPPVEPAESARQWKKLGRIPEDAAARLRAFVSSPGSGARHAAMRAMVRDEAQLRGEYARAMRFLYEKEWGSQQRAGAARREYVAGLYQSRGHSTDTDVTAGYGVHLGLGTLAALRPGLKIRRVLLVGPGLDWAPRMGLEEDSPPQSLQPFALADSLVRLGLAAAEDLVVDCVDVNPRVVGYVNAFAGGKRRLWLRETPGDAEWRNYFLGLGQAIGRRQGLTIDVVPGVAKGIRARQMNVLTQRVTNGEYDLAVATNVLLYFNDRELGLALANIGHAVRTGGHLLHNELRPAAEAWGRELGMPAVQARTVQFAAERALYDAVVLHEVRK
jgi:SAM-dependent methyltransferase